MASSSIKSLRASWADNQPLALLGPEFYARNTLEVARDLLGKVLVVVNRGQILAGRIVETEGYHEDDPASHASRGQTPRSSVMFEEPGRAYVYFIYGMYEMLNFVTEPKGNAGAVLIRALEPLTGLESMARRRKISKKAFERNPSQLTNGPGKLCVALGISKSHNRASLQGPKLFVADDGMQPASITKSPRIGISSGQDRLWRYFITNHPSVSPVKENAQGVLHGR